MEGPGVAHWPEVAQGLRYAGACLKDCCARAKRRRELAFGSRQQPREGDDDPREENEPKSATGGKVRGREGAAQEVRIPLE
ncbi:Carboxylesterase 1D [Varanus komodoensis]|nr:Carboxylesterase 1D [Varanus komodoensis]